MFYDNFPAYLFSMAEISWWNPSPCLLLTAPRFRREKSKWECEKLIFNDILYPILWYAFNKSSTNS